MGNGDCAIGAKNKANVKTLQNQMSTFVDNFTNILHELGDVKSKIDVFRNEVNINLSNHTGRLDNHGGDIREIKLDTTSIKVEQQKDTMIHLELKNKLGDNTKRLTTLENDKSKFWDRILTLCSRLFFGVMLYVIIQKMEYILSLGK